MNAYVEAVLLLVSVLGVISIPLVLLWWIKRRSDDFNLARRRFHLAVGVLILSLVFLDVLAPDRIEGPLTWAKAYDAVSSLLLVGVASVFLSFAAFPNRPGAEMKEDPQ